jgi:uncharacterized protein (TIGR02271 family)
MKTIVAMFDRIEDARDALEDLVDSGIQRDNISLIARDVEGQYGSQMEGRQATAGEDVGQAAAGGAAGGAVLGGLAGVLVGLGALTIPGIGPVVAAGPIVSGLTGAAVGAAAGGLLGALVEWGIPEEEAEYYAEGVRRGGTLVAVRATDTEAEDVVDILEGYDPVDIERRSEYWRSEEDWTGYDPEAEPWDANRLEQYQQRRETWESEYDFDDDYDYDMDDDTIDVAEEELRVGKRQVQSGGVRVRSHVVSEPVEEDVQLRQENVSVDRRRTDRPADEADFQERSVEMTETHEEPVVEKRARVTEEVSLRKDTDIEDRTIRDEVRRTEVEIEDIGGDYEGMDTSRFDEFEPRFRNHYNTTFGSSNYTYDQYTPAYRYGHMLAMDPRYTDTNNWSDLEGSARRDWERHNQGTWEEFKDAVRHGWNETRRTLS